MGSALALIFKNEADAREPGKFALTTRMTPPTI